MRRHAPLFLLVLLASAPGCETIGSCDEAAARALAYDEDGIPAYAGQAIVIQSCGGGTSCHSEGAIAERRYGAPASLDLDVSLASTNGELALDQVDRLDRNQLALLHARGLVWMQIEAGSMPPGGIGEAILAAAPRYDHLVEGELAPLPRLDDGGERGAEAREIVRNWLACRAPVVERTERRSDMDPETIGAVVPAIPRRCADVTWPSLYATIFGGQLRDLETGELRGGRCAYAGCHGDARGPTPSFALERPDAATVDGWLEAIRAVGRRLAVERSMTATCRREDVPYITPGMPDASLLVLKLGDDPPCGDPMPLVGGPLLAQRMCALEEWIRCGACMDEAGCEPACLDAARALCGVTDQCVVTGLPGGS